MIDKVHILALKSIKDLSVECSKLNLFVGTNSSGKSTFQLMQCFQEAAKQQNWLKRQN